MLAYLELSPTAAALCGACLLVACSDDTSIDPTGEGTGTTMSMPDDTGTTGAVDTTDSGDSTTVVADDTADDTSTGGPTTDDGTDTMMVDGSSDDATTGPGNQPPTAHHDPYALLVPETDLDIDAADGVLSNDRDPDDDPLTVTDSDAASAQGGTVSVQDDGAFTYSAPVGFWGEDSFTYTIDDGAGNSAVGVVNVTVAPTVVDLAETGAGQYGFVINGAVDDEAGRQMAPAGDVNGDGLGDMLVASTTAAGGVGQVFVVFGQTGGSSIDLDDVALGMGGFVITGDTADEGFAISAGGGGDFNGDGLDDIVIGSPGAGNAGEAYVVHGKADGTEVTVTDLDAGNGGFVLTGQVVNDEAGTAVAMVGDVNGDGLDDIAIGAPFAGTTPESGRTYIVHGITGTDSIALSDVLGGMGGFVANGEGVDDRSGLVLDGGCDVNDDGLDDIVIGAAEADPNGGNSGAAYVVFGKTDNGSVNLVGAGDAAFSINGIAAIDLAGDDVGMAGDVNGDGRCDVIVGASGAQDDLNFQGQAYVVFGKNDGDDVELAEVLDGMGGFGIDGEAAGSFLGLAVTGVGDVDGDGFSDLLVGTANADFAGNNAGRAHLVFGKSNGARVELTDVSMGIGGFALDGETADDTAGFAVSPGGDIDGDGYADLLVGAPGATNNGADSGSVYVMFGASWTGRVGYVGGAEDDTFFGAPANEGMVAGRGADILHGGGGSDVLYAGAQDDLITIDVAQFFRVHGGRGRDTLALNDADSLLNLVVIPNLSIRDVEVIDLTGTGDNELIMGADDVRAVMGASNVLQIVGDTGDVADIDLSDEVWNDDGSADGFDRYTNGVHVLEVSTDITATVTL